MLLPLVLAAYYSKSPEHHTSLLKSRIFQRFLVVNSTGVGSGVHQEAHGLFLHQERAKLAG